MAENAVGTDQVEGTTGEGTAEVAQTTHYPDSKDAKGQSAESKPTQTTEPKGTEKSEDYVFDPQEWDKSVKDLPDATRKQADALRKNLQRAFTKKTQAIAADRQKIEAFDAFNRDPVSQLTKMAERMGYKLTPAQQAQMAQDVAAGGEWEPKTWDDVMARARTEAKREIMKELQPMLGEVQNIKKQSIETMLTEIDPGWQEYEETMMSNLREHPTLSHDPAMLYRLSVPQEVLESRATQRALKKMQTKVDSGRVSGPSQTNKLPKTGVPDKALSFQEAVQLAKKRIAEEGIQ